MIKQKFLSCFNFSSFNFSLYEKYIPNILMVSKTRYIHCISRTANVTLFRTPIPPVPCVLKFSFHAEKRDRKTLSNLEYRTLLNHEFGTLSNFEYDTLFNPECEILFKPFSIHYLISKNLYIRPHIFLKQPETYIYV